MAPKYLDLKDTKQNPMFQVLKVKSRQEKYIRVRNMEQGFGRFTFRVDSAQIMPFLSLLVHYLLCISVYCILQFLVNNKTWGPTLKCSTADEGNTPLHAAARQGNHLAVKVMLDEGLDARTKNKHCQTPMHLAAKEGHYV